jgi:hypothetical protein
VPEPHVYDVMERPDAEVLVDGQWWPAELRMRTSLPGGSYRYNASWHRDGHTYLDDFDQDQVRLDTVDRSAGRGGNVIDTTA